MATTGTTVGSFGGAGQLEAAKTSSYTIVVGDNGTLFTNAGAGGAVTFTLPAIAANLSFDFYVVADNNVIVASAEGDNIVIFNDAAADSIAFQTSGKKIGASLNIRSNAAGTLWYARPVTWTDGTTTQTITTAT